MKIGCSAVVAAVMFTVDYVGPTYNHGVQYIVVGCTRSHLLSVARCVGRPSGVPRISSTGRSMGKLSHN